MIAASRTLLRTFCVVILAGFLTQDCLAQRKLKVLVLHSYHQGLEWTDHITQGIQSAFANFHKNYELHYEYLDLKRNSGADYLDKITKLTSSIHKNIAYEVVMASDNSALNLIKEKKITFHGEPPIVFCGVNNYSEELIRSIPQVTGIAETTDHQATLNVMHKLHPERRHVLVIIDNTPTGKAIHQELKAIEHHYHGQLEFEYYRNFLLEEIPGKLKKLGDNDIIYLSALNRDRKNSFISYTEGIEMIRRSTGVPIYGSWDFYLGKGIVGGKITSGLIQGKKVGELALKILHGHQAKDLPVDISGQNRYIFDYEEMRRYGISKTSLPKGSRIINLPPNLYKRYKTALIGMTTLSLAGLLILLWKYLAQQSLLRTKQALTLTLESQVRERTQELEAANRKLEHLSNLDGLTQIYNRRYFDAMLSKEIKQLQRLSAPISLLLCDIDFFKRYNDSYGHLAGDDCIKTVAEAIQAQCKRLSDVAARYGGEEFGVILPSTRAEDAVAIAEAICHDIASRKIAYDKSPIKDIVSLSIGIATIVPDLHTTPCDLIKLADQALYDSKHLGRDRVTLKTSS